MMENDYYKMGGPELTVGADGKCVKHVVFYHGNVLIT